MVTYDRDADFSVSQSKVMELLTKGIITKDDFVGEDVNKVIMVGKVKDRATFIIKDMRIADRSAENLEVTVVNSQKEDWMMGQSTLKQFGSFEFNTDEHKLIFK